MTEAVLMTGATGHLGKEMLKELLRDWNVICISRRPIDLSLIDTSFHKRIINLRFDIQATDVSSIVDSIEMSLARNALSLSGLVNNAYFLDVIAHDDMSTVSCDSALNGLFAFHVKLTLEIMKRGLFTDSSSVVNVSSMYAKVAPDPSNYPQGTAVNPVLYGSMKAALSQSTRYLSANMASHGVRVNSVSYGPFPSLEVQEKSPDFIERLASRTHLGRIGKAEESAGVIKFLLSKQSSYITGADISVDGGWTAW